MQYKYCRDAYVWSIPGMSALANRGEGLRRINNVNGLELLG